MRSAGAARSVYASTIAESSEGIGNQSCQHFLEPFSVFHDNWQPQ